ncbi:MAG: PPC domain-containing protein, partial [Myxococcota bacterium]|nr:PPC domain-containing protein [Myxococcota bacterium]
MITSPDQMMTPPPELGECVSACSELTSCPDLVTVCGENTASEALGRCISACEGENQARLVALRGQACEAILPTLLVLLDLQESCSSGLCGNVVCPAGLSCESSTQRCVDPCDGVSCAAGERCEAGACVDRCAGVECPFEQVCVNGLCTDPCEGVSCEEDERCELGACVALCEGVSCDASERCDENSGNCVALCAGVSCPATERCEETSGDCVSLCEGVSCGEEERCEETSGECVPNCLDVDCEEGWSCVPESGLCEVQDPCAGLDCPIGNTCDPLRSACAPFLECLSGTGDLFDPPRTPLGNNTYESATTLEPVTQLLNDLSICPFDNDYYRFTIPEGVSARAGIFFDHDGGGIGDLSLSYFEASNQRTAEYESASRDDNEFISIPAGPAREITLRVYPPTGANTNRYALFIELDPARTVCREESARTDCGPEINCVEALCVDTVSEEPPPEEPPPEEPPPEEPPPEDPPAPGDEEPLEGCRDDFGLNHVRGDAYALEAERSPWSGRICVRSDWFSFSAEVGTQVYLRLRFEDLRGDLDLEIYRPNGELLERFDGAVDSEVADFIADQAGDYLVHVYPFEA